MKVKDLKHLLKNADPESEIFLQGDPEGNFFNSIWGVAIGNNIHHFTEDDIHDKEANPLQNDTVVIVPDMKIFPY